MKGKGIYLLLAYYMITRSLCDYVDGDNPVQMCTGDECYTYGDILYYLINSMFIGSVAYYMFTDSLKNLSSKITLGCVLLFAFSQGVNTAAMMLGFKSTHYLDVLLWVLICIDVAVFIWENREKILNVPHSMVDEWEKRTNGDV